MTQVKKLICTLDDRPNETRSKNRFITRDQESKNTAKCHELSSFKFKKLMYLKLVVRPQQNSKWPTKITKHTRKNPVKIPSLGFVFGGSNNGQFVGVQNIVEASLSVSWSIKENEGGGGPDANSRKTRSLTVKQTRSKAKKPKIGAQATQRFVNGEENETAATPILGFNA